MTIKCNSILWMTNIFLMARLRIVAEKWKVDGTQFKVRASILQIPQTYKHQTYAQPYTRNNF